MADKARELGFKPGYASAKYKDKYGDWPPREWSNALKSAHAADREWQARQVERERVRDFWQIVRSKPAGGHGNPKDEPTPEELEMVEDP
jgi:hypothetical protein